MRTELGFTPSTCLLTDGSNILYLVPLFLVSTSEQHISVGLITKLMFYIINMSVK